MSMSQHKIENGNKRTAKVKGQKKKKTKHERLQAIHIDNIPSGKDLLSGLALMLLFVVRHSDDNNNGNEQ